MEPIKICVVGASAKVTYAPTVTSGTVGLPVEFTFDSSWDGLTKTAVFEAGGTVRDRLGVGTTTTVPSEVLQIPGRTLLIGVQGLDADNNIIIASTMAQVDAIIRRGADPSGGEGLDPELPAWQQMLNRLIENEAKSEEVIAQAEEAAVRASAATAEADIAADRANGAAARCEEFPCRYIESSAADPVCVCTLGSGVYILNGTFRPYLDASWTTKFDHCFAVIQKKNDGHNGGWMHLHNPGSNAIHHYNFSNHFSTLTRGDLKYLSEVPTLQDRIAALEGRLAAAGL
jgi:hypothetical protein